MKSTIESHFSSQERDEDSRRQPLNSWADYLYYLTLRRSMRVTLDEFLAECRKRTKTLVWTINRTFCVPVPGMLSLANCHLIGVADQKPGEAAHPPYRPRSVRSLCGPISRVLLYLLERFRRLRKFLQAKMLRGVESCRISRNRSCYDGKFGPLRED